MRREETSPPLAGPRGAPSRQGELPPPQHFADKDEDLDGLEEFYKDIKDGDMIGGRSFVLGGFEVLAV